MAATDLRAVLSCSICKDIYKEPVTLTCGHNFCQNCINEVFDREREEYKCPECQKIFQRRPELTRNPTLKSIAEACAYSWQEQVATGICCTFCDLAVTAVQSCLQCETSMCDNHVRKHNQIVKHILLPATMSLDERKCSIHKKILDYFCTTDLSCICSTCYVAGDHAGHSVESLEEALEKKKEKLRNIEEDLTSRRKDIVERLQTLQKSRTERQKKALQPVDTIIAHFIDIRKDLDNLEKKVFDEIYKQEENQSLSSRVQQLELIKIQLSSKMRYIQDLHDMANPVSILKEQESSRDDFCDIEEREESGTQYNNEVHSVSELDVGPISEKLNTLSDLIRGITDGLYVQEYIDLSLNESTAGPNVLVLKDEKTVSWSPGHQNFPETPERFHCNQVLSHESVSSGQHYWDVETSDSGDWRIGVCYPSIEKETHPSIIGNSKKSWCLHRCNNPITLPSDSNKSPRYMIIHDDNYINLPYTVSSNGLRVSLDYEGGQLSFYELGDSIWHLHTFYATFSEPLHAAFYVWDKVNGKGSWVRILGSGSQ